MDQGSFPKAHSALAKLQGWLGLETFADETNIAHDIFLVGRTLFLVTHTLILVGLLWNGTGAFVLGMGGEIQWDWLPMLVVGSLVGGYLGAHVSIQRGSSLVKRGFELLAFVMGISLLIRSI